MIGLLTKGVWKGYQEMEVLGTGKNVTEMMNQEDKLSWGPWRISKSNGLREKKS